MQQNNYGNIEEEKLGGTESSLNDRELEYSKTTQIYVNRTPSINEP